MLTHLLSSRYTSSSPPLIVISDSLLQPGLSLLHQLTLSSSPSTQTIYLCIDQPPSISVPSGLESDQLQVIDLTIDEGFPIASTSTSQTTTQLDLASEGAQVKLEEMLEKAVGNAKLKGGAVQIVLDGINSLGDQLEGVNGVWRIVKKGLKALEGLPLGSRFILLHHDHFPSLPSSTSSSSASLLSSLLSPLLSPSTIHLTLHPTSHFHTLALRYSLTLPTPTSFDDPDLRTIDFLSRLRERGLGDPLRRPERSDEDDERVLMDDLSSGEGKCVLGWNCRGVTMGKIARGSTGVGGGAAGDKKVVSWGFEGIRRRDEGTSEVEEVELGRVLDPRRMGKVRDDALLSPPIQQTSNPISSTTPSHASSNSTSTTALPFSLSLTPSQLAARSLVQNPYEGSNQPIFGEAGYTGKMDDPPVRGLRVEYTADRGDDLDEEEPDEDLEI